MSIDFERFLSEYPHMISAEEAKQAYASMPDSYRNWVSECAFVAFATTERANFLFQDYETGGIDPRIDAPLQFASVRTDMELRVIDEPFSIYCYIAGDRIPHPEALLVTGLSLKDIQEKGVSEPEFFKAIYRKMMDIPSTISLGYNTLGYDDEMTRHGFHRNLLPAYEREYAQNNSRWDIFPLVAAVYALDRNALQWPYDEEKGRVSLRLESLCKINEITQTNAHNAVDDSLGTIGLARKIKENSPAIFKYFFEHRTKKEMELVFKPGLLALYISTKNGNENSYMTPIILIGPSSTKDKNKWLALDLQDMDEVRAMWKSLRTANQDLLADLKRKMYSSNEDLEQRNEKRPPIKIIAINKCPMLVPSDHELSKCVKWDQYHRLQDAVLSGSDESVNVRRCLLEVVNQSESPACHPDVSLYDGFPSKSDQRLVSDYASMQSAELLTKPSAQFNSDILADFYQIMCIKWKNKQGIQLSEEEQSVWTSYCQSRLNTPVQRSAKHLRPSITELKVMLQEPKYQHLKSDYEYIFGPL